MNSNDDGAICVMCKIRKWFHYVKGRETCEIPQMKSSNILNDNSTVQSSGGLHEIRI